MPEQLPKWKAAAVECDDCTRLSLCAERLEEMAVELSMDPAFREILAKMRCTVFQVCSLSVPLTGPRLWTYHCPSSYCNQSATRTADIKQSFSSSSSSSSFSPPPSSHFPPSSSNFNSASEVTTVWRYGNSIIIIIIRRWLLHLGCTTWLHTVNRFGDIALQNLGVPILIYPHCFRTSPA